jgi:hypothetical protein
MKPLSDKSLLNAKIALAKSIVNDSISGLDIGNYTTVATTALGTKIAAAETVSNNAAAKQADVDAAATALETGLFDVEKARLQNTIQAATNIMNNGSFPASAKAQLATIITESTTILQSATTRDQLVNATNNIIAGVNNMRNSNGQALKLTRGWNMITINVQSADSTITSIFKNTSISEIKTSDKFWSKNTPIQLNSLNVITTGQAYLVKITNISDSIFIAGKNISAQSFPPTNLKSGWNLVGYPHTTSQSISTVLSSTPSIITVKNTQGFWIKGNQLSNLSEFKPGECYYIKKQ